MTTIPTEESALGQAGAMYPEEAFKEMIDAGVFYGRKKNKTNPRMKQFIYGNRSGIEIIDLNKTLASLNKALAFIKEELKGGNSFILFVGTQPAAEGIKTIAQKFGMPYVEKRWIGGTLTNFGTILKRVERLKKLKDDRDKGALEKYTKKERLMFGREIVRLEGFFGSLSALNRTPDILFVIDSNVHKTAVREARRLGIPIVSFDSTDANPDSTDYPVIGNNASRQSIGWFLEKVEVTIQEALEEAKKQVNIQEEAA